MKQNSLNTENQATDSSDSINLSYLFNTGRQAHSIGGFVNCNIQKSQEMSLVSFDFDLLLFCIIQKQVIA